MQCPRNLSQQEIFLEYGTDDNEMCSKCPYQSYNNGMITCNLIKMEVDPSDSEQY